jgi:glutamate 5-kinase
VASEVTGRRPRPGAIRRLIVKLGSTTVASPAFDSLVDEVADLVTGGVRVVLVTSGAVAAGMEGLGLSDRPSDTARAQALAAAGQVALMGRYGAALGRHGLGCAQLLLTHEDLSHRRHLLNIRHTLEAAFDLGLVPVVNENDTVATEELRFGDNDRLAAALGSVVDADLVVLLSDVDALYDADPFVHADAKPLEEVTVIDSGIRAIAGASSTRLGTGGMASKVAAAELAMGAGVSLIVASGSEVGILRRLVDGEVLGTHFVPPADRIARRRHWIGSLSKIAGTLEVDAGASKALRETGSSLLAIGITAVEGVFERGDAVCVVDPEREEIGRGLVGYGSAEVGRIAGHRTPEVPTILGVAVAGPVIHRDDFVLAGPG